jgi:phage-related tail fiber protein
MGANQSKHGGKKGKSGQTLGGGKDVLGGGGGGGGESAAAVKDSPRNAGDPRTAAAEAAERRMKAVRSRRGPRECFH